MIFPKSVVLWFKGRPAPPSVGASSLLPLACAGTGCILGRRAFPALAGLGRRRPQPLEPPAARRHPGGVVRPAGRPPVAPAPGGQTRAGCGCACIATRSTPARSRPPSTKGWLPVDQYLEKSLNVEVSHGICPHCVQKHYGQQAQDLALKYRYLTPPPPLTPCGPRPID